MIRPRRLGGARVGVDTAGLAASTLDLAKSEGAKQLRALGLTDEQIALLVQATGSSPEALVALGKEKLIAMLGDAKTLAVAYARAAISDRVVQGMKDLGFTQAEAEALAATGGSLEKLKALGKAKLGDLVVDLNERLKKEGVDLAGRAASGLGIPPEKLAGIARGASAAYTIFSTVSSAINALGSAYNYSRSEWSGDFFAGDASLKNLSRAIDQMAGESDAIRSERSAVMKRTVQSFVSEASKILGTVPVYGWMIAGAASLGVEFASSMGWFEPGVDDNAEIHSIAAKAYAKRLWDEYGFAPPAFDSSSTTLNSYATDDLGWELMLLDASETATPWRAKWIDLVTWAMNQPLTDATKKPHPAPLALLSRGWFPLQFSEWIGGASPVKSHNLGSSPSRRETSMGATPEGVLVGTVGAKEWIKPVPREIAHMFLSRTMPALARAALMRGGNLPAWYPGFGFPPRQIETKDAIGFPKWIDEPSVIAPRSPALQRMIRERMAAVVGTLTAARQGVTVEATVEACVRQARADMDAHGFDPRFAASDFANVVLAATGSAFKSLDLKPLASSAPAGLTDVRYLR